MEILYKILDEKTSRKELISEFQEKVWSSESEDELLSQLAYDLDFYEPVDRLRSEDSSFYGDEELESLLKAVLKKSILKKHRNL